MSTIIINGTPRNVDTMTLDEIEAVWPHTGRVDRERAHAAIDAEKARPITVASARAEGPFVLRCLKRFCSSYAQHNGRAPEVTL